MSYGETITRTDLKNILNDVLPPSSTKVVLLGSSSVNGNFTLSSDIDNFSLIGITIFDQTYLASHGYNMCSPSTLKLYNSTTHAFGFSGYNSGRIYAYVNYVNDTTLNAQVSSGYGVAVYGITFGVDGGGSRTLLWTNPNPTSAMSAQQLIASGADSYDEIQVVYKTAHVYDGWQTQTAPFVSGAHITLLAPSGANGEFSGAIVNAVRTITMSSGGKLTADNAGVFTTSSFSTNNNMCIPVYIYGIKH